MSASRNRRATLFAALASMAMLLGAAVPASAAEPAFQMDLPAGLACAGFDLRVEGYGSGFPVNREFAVPGGTIRILSAGPGFQLTFTNLGTGRHVDLDSNGAVSWTRVYDDGSAAMALTGHNVVILFPADGGPSTDLYVGRVRIDVAPDGVWTVQGSAGAQLDICAALS